MIRKISLAVAILAVGFVVAAPAQAGGSNGAKKTATLRARNITGVPGTPGTAVYAFALPTGTAAPTTASGAQSLGAKQIALNSVGNFPVAPGSGNFVAAWAAAAVAAAPNLPANFDNAGYTSAAGIKGYLTITGDETGGDLAPTVTPGGGPF